MKSRLIAVITHRFCRAAPNKIPGEPRYDSERHEHRYDARYECQRQHDTLETTLGLTGAKYTHRDGNHRINAGRQADEDSAEPCRADGRQRPLLQGTGKCVRIGLGSKCRRTQESRGQNQRDEPSWSHADNLTPIQEDTSLSVNALGSHKKLRYVG